MIKTQKQRPHILQILPTTSPKQSLTNLWDICPTFFDLLARNQSQNCPMIYEREEVKLYFYFFVGLETLEVLSIYVLKRTEVKSSIRIHALFKKINSSHVFPITQFSTSLFWMMIQGNLFTFFFNLWVITKFSDQNLKYFTIINGG